MTELICQILSLCYFLIGNQGPVVQNLTIKYGINANIFAEKMWVAFAFAKATHIFSAKLPVD